MTAQATDSLPRMGVAFVRRAPAPDLPPPALLPEELGAADEPCWRGQRGELLTPRWAELNTKAEGDREDQESREQEGQDDPR